MSRLIARFVVDEGPRLRLLTRYDARMDCEVLEAADPVAVSILARHPAAGWFERKAHDDFGVRFELSYDQRPLVHHEHIAPGQRPMRKAFDAPQLAEQAPRPYPYEVVEGDTTYEIAVGPIHAGIIEPGHFHFSQAGEQVLHLEVRHFYKYRAIEKRLEGCTLDDAWPVVSRISGHSSVAWQWAVAEAAWAAAGQAMPDAARANAALLLELERLAHHLTDLGFIPNDAGFAAAFAWATMLAEQVRRMLADLTGHRFGFDALRRPVRLDAQALRRAVAAWRAELQRFADWIEGVPSLWDRLDTTGKLKPEQARQFDVVGVMARASSVALDVRSEQALYGELGFETLTQRKGDVAARFRQRLAEAFQSLELIEALLAREMAPVPLPPLDAGEGEGRIESVLGELYVWLKVVDGRIERFYARDPSFVNWQALHLMLPGNIIADFPLINKSCDLSYAGSDL